MASQNGLFGLIKLLLFLGLLFVAYKEGVPWLSDQLGRMGESVAESAGASSEGGLCASRASRASSIVGREARGYMGPRPDVDGWRAVLPGIEDELRTARDACRCQLDSCRRANSALDSLEDFVRQVDGGVAGGSIPFNAAARLQSIDEQIDGAKGLARQGR